MLLFQTEWNNGALVILALIALVPIIVVFFVLRMLLGFSPAIDKFLTKSKIEKKAAYYSFHIVLFIISGILTLGGAALYYSITEKG